MTTPWQSTPKKFCEICKCWFADNKVSIAFHENGLRHKGNLAQKLRQVAKAGSQRDKDDKATKAALAKMESAAVAAASRDMANPETAALYGVASTSTQRSGVGRCSEEWLETKTKDGFAYYWNTNTNETRWEKPVGNVSVIKADIAKTIKSIVAEQNLPVDGLNNDVIDSSIARAEGAEVTNVGILETKHSNWAELKTAEGDVYFWNSATNETRWSLPSDESCDENEDSDESQTFATKNKSHKRKDEDFKRAQKVKNAKELDRVQKEESEEDTFVNIDSSSKMGQWTSVSADEKSMVPAESADSNKCDNTELDVGVEKKDKFKEKTVLTLKKKMADSGNTTFKKRKIAHGRMRNRKADSDEDR